MASIEKRLGSDDATGKSIKNEANILFKGGKFEEAIALYENALNLDLSTDLIYSISINAAISASNCYEYLKARDYSIKSIQIDNKSIRGYFWKGMSEVYLELFSDAEETFQTALKIDKNNADIKKRVKFLNFCACNIQYLTNFPKKNWLKIEDAVQYNLNYSSSKNFANEMTKMIRRRKNGSIVCISGGVCNFFGKIIDLEIPVHALTKKQQENVSKLNSGEYNKFFIQIIMSATLPPCFEFKIASKQDEKQFNDAQKFCFELIETAANNDEITAPFNPFLSTILISEIPPTSNDTNNDNQSNGFSSNSCTAPSNSSH